MKKMILILAVLWFGLNAFAKSVQADEYNTAVIGHVVKETVSGNGVDTSVPVSYTHLTLPTIPLV